MSKPSKLIGKQVFLRPPRLADFREYAAAIRKRAELHGRWINPFQGKKQFDQYLRELAAKQQFRFLICRQEDGAIVGMISLFHIIRYSLQTACVGYLVAASHVRQGYATEALQLTLDFAFKKLKLHRIEAIIHPENAASIALARRAGFKFEGRSRRYLKIRGKWLDHERWAILNEDPRPNRYRSHASSR